MIFDQNRETETRRSGGYGAEQFDLFCAKRAISESETLCGGRL